MPIWERLIESAAIVLLLVLLLGVALIVRRRWLSRNGGTFELSYRARTTTPGRGWLLGLGRYNGSRGKSPYPDAVLGASKNWVFSG